jgi:uncharacterized damage-inducible protein DinB
MTIGLERLLRHMAWANQQTIRHLMTLPDEALQSFATNPDWKVSEILRHIVEAGNFYVYRLTGSFPAEKFAEEFQPSKHEDLQLLLAKAELVDKALLECESLEDIQMEFVTNAGKQVKRWRSTILSTSIHHAIEHRAQLAYALEAKGFSPVDFDQLDLWSFESAQG